MNLKKNGNTDTHNRNVFFLLCVLLGLLFFGALIIGRFQISITDTIRILISRLLPLQSTWSERMENVILNIRLPRVMGALIVGSSLSLSGAVYQGMFRNPLVSPDLLGVSAGCCVGAAFAILLRLGSMEIQLFALIGGLAAVSMTVFIPTLFKNKSALMLVLSGIIVSGFMNAILGILKYVADPESTLASIVYWTMGSLSSVRQSDILTIAPFMGIATVILLLLRWRINILSLGDHEARSLGLSVLKMRRIVVLCATILTAASICISGAIGWIGLIIPHLGRLLVGHDNKILLPVTVLLGGCFMIFVDTLARNLTGSEIPLSILTGLFGTPLFIWLLVQQKTKVD